MTPFVLFLAVWRNICLRRNVVAMTAFFGFFNVYMLRATMSVAIIAMTENRTETIRPSEEVNTQVYSWNSVERGNILASFYYGYITTQIIGGFIGTKIGGARLYGSGIFATAALNLLIPYAANFGIISIILIRALEGVFEGVTYPCMHVVWSKWAPPSERTRLATLAYSGAYVGTALSFPVCGFLADTYGWPSIFYSTGVIALTWCLIWFICVKDSPEYDPWITEKELKYIKESLTGEKRIVHPWKSFFTSMPVWAIITAHFCENWGFCTMLTMLPTFMTDVFQYSIQRVGILSAIPYVAMSIVLPIGGYLADVLRRNQILTTTEVRRIFNCVAFIIQGVFLLLAVEMSSISLTVICITIAVGFGGLASSGYGVNHLDIAPQHAGVLLGISNSIGNFPGFLSPSVAGIIVKHKSRLEWRIVFFISSLVYFLGAIFYYIFASGEVQPWAISDKSQENSMKNEISAIGNGNKNGTSVQTKLKPVPGKRDIIS